MRKTHRPLTQTDVAKILLGLVVIIIIIFAYLFIPRTKEVIKSFKHKKVIVKDSVTVKDVTITLYQPTAKQCGNNKNITANGEHGHIGTCAASLCMFEYNVNVNDRQINQSASCPTHWLLPHVDGQRLVPNLNIPKAEL